MTEQRQTFSEKVTAFLERVLALRITDDERVRYANDPLNVFSEDFSNQRPMRVAGVLALLIHLFIFLFSFPFLASQVLLPAKEVLVLKQLAMPAALKGGGPPEPQVPKPEPKQVAPKPKPVLVPIPDPTPNDPEPIQRKEVIEAPQILDELALDLNIGDISAPSTGGSGRGQVGTGTGPSSGSGPAAGGGEGPYTLGSGVTNPVPIRQTIPSYTDEAIKAKIQGVVLLQAIIRRDGSVTDFKVLRGLGFGLEEKAIQEIATNWKFRPGTLNGRPVDVLATIEVQFNLR